jgi:hypothetical protein
MFIQVSFPWQENRGSIPGQGEDFLFAIASRIVLGQKQDPSQWVPGAPYLGAKRPGFEANYSPTLCEKD